MGAYFFPKVAAWATYDLANTIFAINILSLYFPLWVTQDQGGSDLLYATVSSLSLFFVSLLMPFLGTLSDSLQRRMLFLIPSTLLCVLATALLSLAPSLGWGLLFFGVAHFGYQLGILFYDALLPELGPPHRVGKISGLGVTLGYGGTLIGLALVRPFVLSQGHQAAFLPTAIFFLLFSLPCFLLVRDSHPLRVSFSNSLLRETIRRLKQGLSHFGKGTPLRVILWVDFFALMAIQPVILFMSIYTQRVIGFSDKEMISFFFLTTLFAILGSFVSGILTDRLGPRKSLLFSLSVWCLGLLSALVITERWHFWIPGSLIGMALGATWVSNRVLIIRASPPEHIGEIFGCVGLVGRFAAILGPLIWGGIIWSFQDYFPWNYKGALLCLLAWFSLSWILLARRLPGKLF